MKKRILFVNESLACAGGEKSLLTLLSLLDYDRYEVDLQLVAYGNEWDRLVDPHVNILPPIPYFSSLSRPLLSDILSVRNISDLRRIGSRLEYAATVRRMRNLRIQEVACEYWRIHGANIPAAAGEYDVAIGYAQGFPSFYVAEKVNAKKKLCWVNAFYEVFPEYRAFVEQRMEVMDNIVAVTPTAAEFLCSHFPVLSPKVKIFPDLMNAVMVRSMSEGKCESIRRAGELTIVTIGRLEWHTKGLDLLLDAARILRDRGLNFKWHILGRGDAHDRMVRYIQDNALTDNVILMGVRPNPYPVLKQADIYVQTSRNEGFGIAIAEARILGIPIVSTEFDTVREQLEHGVNSLLADFSGESIADAICRMNSDSELYRSIRESLRNAKVDNLERLNEFYSLIS